MFKGSRKEDLKIICREIGEQFSEECTTVDLKGIITNSKAYKDDLDFVKDIILNVIEDRKSREQEEKLREERAAKLELEKLEMDKIRLEHEFELEKARIAASTSGGVNSENTSQVSEIKNEGAISIENLIKSIKTLTLAVPSRPEAWNLFFESLERAFQTKKVPSEIKSEILLNLLGEKAMHILIYVNKDELQDYDKLKKIVLKEFEPDPRSCLENFQKARRNSNETHVQFASRLTSSFEYYCKLRKVEDLETLKNLIISDKLFQTLDEETSAHIGIRMEESWFLPQKLSKECDIYFVSKGKSFADVKSTPKYRDNSATNYVQKYVAPPFRREENKNNRSKYMHGNQSNAYNNSNQPNRTCHLCADPSHIARFCPRRNQNKNFETKRYGKDENIKNKKNETAVVANVTSKTNENNILDKNREDTIVAKISSSYFPSENIAEIQQLEKVKILLEGQEIEAINDSGCQIPVINSSLIKNLEERGRGKIILTSAFGESVGADLIYTQISLSQGQGHMVFPIDVLAAVTQELQMNCLLPSKTVEMLRTACSKSSNCLFEEQSDGISVESGLVSPDSRMGDAYVLQSDGEIKKCYSDGLLSNGNNGCGDVNEGVAEQDVLDKVHCLSEASKLREEQQSCDSLKGVRENLKLGKGNLFTVDGLIYHKDKIIGEPVAQLVVPKDRRSQILKLAHESVFGNHMGVKKTKERIRLSFFWPNLAQDVAEFCRTCKNCQLRTPAKVSDRIPITPVLRPEFPFDVVNVDLIGPVDPPCARKFKYVLCLIDQHSRWPEAVPLRSLSAKATCDALLSIFMRTGIPKCVASDMGTNFVSQLTQEFLTRLGSHPRFSTPGYPASNGAVERFNKVFKQMLHHVIRNNPADWDKHIPYLLFAYREVPNCTTGVSPFRLLYGREARGPLAVLKSSWAGEIAIPLSVKGSAVDYLQELKINLEKAAEQASLTASHKQQDYVNYFNRRASSKEFQVGEQVYLLIPDSSNKLYARWTGPGEIIQRVNPHSYRVKLPDGVKHVHANKIRRFYPRVQAVGIVFENEEEFGEIYPTPTGACTDIVTSLRDLQIEHLRCKQKQELISILQQHQSLFTGNVKIAKVGQHKIRLKPNEERKKPFIYRIPEAMKSKVDEQIQELLALDLIEESSAEIAHPVVCVNKKDGGMRLCVDYRSLNSVTIADDFPMQDASELIHSIGQANIISTLDLLKGYWAIPMEEESKDFTSFKTHRQQYRFKVMSFGLRNASATFQREMNKALAPYRDFSRAYIDDIAIFSADWESHLTHLDIILSLLERLNFTVNLKKCHFAKSQIKYLGHIIGSGKHQADPEKVQAVAQLPTPKTKKELRSVLGLCNYYRDYIPKYSEVVFPLTELTKRKVPDNLPWSEEHESAFHKLKSALVEAPSLHTPILGRPFIIHSDASQIGIAACLSQRFEDKIYPIAYASQKLTKTQQSWSTIEREAFAIVWSLKKFEAWVFGAEIEFYTDHNPLPYLTRCAPQSSRLQRWAFALQKYNITMKHCPGSKMPNADALSRLFA